MFIKNYLYIETFIQLSRIHSSIIYFIVLVLAYEFPQFFSEYNDQKAFKFFSEISVNVLF